MTIRNSHFRNSAARSGKALIERLERRELLTAVDAPYTGTPFTVNQSIPAVQYDTGGEGVSYHDTTATNLGNANFRTGEAVDIETGGSTGKVVGFTAAGEWLNYTVKVPSTGVYVLAASVADVQSGASFHVGIGTTALTPSVAVPMSPNWQTYFAACSARFNLSAGTHVLRITMDHAAPNSSAGNYDWFKLVPISTPPVTTPPVTTPPTSPPPSGTLPALSWKTEASAPVAVAESESVSVGGKLYVFGGYNVSSPDFQATTAAQAYNPSTNTWARLAAMPVAETQMGVASDGTYIYVVGGYTYDPATTWQKFGTTNDFRYDIATNTWSSFVPLPAARGAGAMVILNDQLHYFDGVDTSRAGQNEHWVLNLGSTSPQWTTAAALPLGRNHITAAVLNGKIYAIGGQTTSDDSTTDSQVYVWDPANPSTWTSVASLPFSFSHAVAAVVDGEIVIAGGEKADDVPIASVLAYNPSTNTWKTEASLPAARLSPAGGVVGNQLIITTGFANGGFTSATWSATI